MGIAVRLQGHQDENLLWNSPQIGALFEPLFFSEIIKTRDNYLKDWKLYTWRTKEQNEIDFILKIGDKHLFIEVKLGIHSAKAFSLDTEALKVFQKSHKKIVVTVGDKILQLDSETSAIPIHLFGQYLLDF